MDPNDAEMSADVNCPVAVRFKALTHQQVVQRTETWKQQTRSIQRRSSLTGFAVIVVRTIRWCSCSTSQFSIRQEFGDASSRRRDWVMPVGYIEPKNVLLDGRQLPHELRGMNPLARIARTFATFAAKPASLCGSIR